jgi:hypothetical protein
MWVPARIVYLIAGLALFAAWLNDSDNPTLHRAILLSCAMIACVGWNSCGPTVEHRAAKKCSGIMAALHATPYEAVVAQTARPARHRTPPRFIGDGRLPIH